jgi:hypothetical protein
MRMMFMDMLEEDNDYRAEDDIRHWDKARSD